MSEEFVFPEYLDIKENTYGLGTYTKKAFKKGDLVMRSRARILTKCEFTSNKKFDINIKEHKYTLDPQIHTCISKGKIYLFTFDAFMNHSCDPNLYNVEDVEIKDNFFYYNKFALRDIKAGEELVTNYLFFENDSEYEFVCGCKSENCFGTIKGRNYLNHKQLDILKKQVL